MIVVGLGTRCTNKITRSATIHSKIEDMICDKAKRAFILANSELDDTYTSRSI